MSMSRPSPSSGEWPRCESFVGCAPHPWGTHQARHRYRRTHRLPPHAEAASPALADLADVPRQPSPRLRLDRFLHHAHRSPSRPVRPRRPRPPPPAARPLQRHRASHRDSNPCSHIAARSASESISCGVLSQRVSGRGRNPWDRQPRRGPLVSEVCVLVRAASGGSLVVRATPRSQRFRGGPLGIVQPFFHLGAARLPGFLRERLAASLPCNRVSRTHDLHEPSARQVGAVPQGKVGNDQGPGSRDRLPLAEHIPRGSEPSEPQQAHP